MQPSELSIQWAHQHKDGTDSSVD